jgi:hypothetical protein
MNTMHDWLSQILASTSTLRELPPAAHALAIGGLITGLALWLFGGKLLKPAFALLGLVIGGMLGFLLVPAFFSTTILGVPSPYVGLGLGLLLGLIQGLVLFRFSMAICTALILGLAATLGAAAWMKFEPLKRAADVANQPVSTLTGSVPAGASSLTIPTREEAIEKLRPVAERVGAFLDDAGEQLKSEWTKLTPRQQGTLVISGLAGILGGLILGLVFPKKSSALVTALVGAAVWIPCAAWLAIAANAPGNERLNFTAFTWLLIWLGVTILGLVIQATLLKKKAPKSE